MTITPKLRVKITHIDGTVVSQADKLLDDTSLPRVPVVYPYLYIDYHGPLEPSAVRKYCNTLKLSLNEAIGNASKRFSSMHANRRHHEWRFIRHILFVKAMPFYGFHHKYQPYLKILLADPQLLQTAATILRSGAILGRKFSVYEAHLGYLLQFLTDFNLYGCGWLELKDAWIRREDDTDQNIPSLPFATSPLRKSARTPFEFDAQSFQILNRRLVPPRPVPSKLVIPRPNLSAPLPQDSKSMTPSSPHSSQDSKVVHSIRELWDTERARRTAQGLDPSPPLPVEPSSSQRSQLGLTIDNTKQWQSSIRDWAALDERIEKERGMWEADDGEGKDTDHQDRWEDLAWTSFESTEMLWDPMWHVVRPNPQVSAGEDGSEEVARQDGSQRSTSNSLEASLTSSQPSNPFQSSPHEDETFDAAGVHRRKRKRGKSDDVPDGVPSSQSGDLNLNIVSSQAVKAAIEEETAFEQGRLVQPQSSQDQRFMRTPSKRSRFIGASTPTTPAGIRLSGSVRSSPFSTPTKFQTHLGDYLESTPTGPSSHRKTTPGVGGREASRELEDNIDGDHVIQLNLNNSSGTNSLPAGEDAEDDMSSKTPRPVNGRRIERDKSDLFTPSTFERQQPVASTSRQGGGVHPYNSDGAFRASLTSPLSSSQRLPRSTPWTNEATHAFVYSLKPPSASALLETLPAYDLPSRVYRDPFYSDPADRPLKPVETAAGYSVVILGTGLSSLEHWDEAGSTVVPDDGMAAFDRPHRSPLRPGAARNKGKDHAGLWLTLGEDAIPNGHGAPAAVGVEAWTYAGEPPRHTQVRKWLSENPVPGTSSTQKVASSRKPAFRSQPTQTTNGKSRKSVRSSSSQMQYMSVLSLEVFAACDEDRSPDPEKDPITALFFCYQSYALPPADSAERRARYDSGIIALANGQTSLGMEQTYPGLASYTKSLVDETGEDHQVGQGIAFVDDEFSLFQVLETVVLDFDPDVLTSFELSHGGWGYVSARHRHLYGGDPSFGALISRLRDSSSRSTGWAGWASGQDPSLLSPGRHVLNLWEIYRKEYTYTSYTFENNVFQLLKKRIPRYSNLTMTRWIKSAAPVDIFRVLRYFEERAILVLELINESDLITKNSEFARVFGVDFMSVLTRGSQFKVEAFMFRLAKPESFMLLSPSREDVGRQNAAECIPMIMEPMSGYYKSPLLVLDFQSLYPSVMIAYNYCYSTCLGRIVPYPRVDGTYKLGWTELDQTRGIFEQLRDHIHVAPNGIVYAKPTVRKSLLAKMLEELLETRVMVKQAMKTWKEDKASNVTYGYTGASFSGRMPCVEIADSIVEAGRQTLENVWMSNAIRFISETPGWGGKVVYGDTDSIFVSLPGKTKDEAFRIGQEIAEKVTLMNPNPIKLKFEKVYFPCVLESKKRYVGFKYESPDDRVPVFDAKGIETVRRDGVRAQAKMLEVCLKILFRTQDLSQVKQYCIQEWSKILGGKVTVQDFAFAKEVRLGTYSEKGNPNAHAVVGALMEEEDKGSFMYGDRVPHVIARRGPQERLAETAHHVKEFLWKEGDGKRQLYLDEDYYIRQVIIPPLSRVFDHIGADVRQWFQTMPKIRRADAASEHEIAQVAETYDLEAPAAAVKPAKYGIDSHFKKSGCLSCNMPTEDNVLCPDCLASPFETLQTSLTRLRDASWKAKDIHQLCVACTSSQSLSDIACESYDCSWFYERRKAENELIRAERMWTAVQNASSRW
ncbi:hypothetical protein DL93DRAFT_2100396 [Clavulina sp. PMI_390]|nr:hypothetical protein DL93DRAFT_2100396 [Clavulina sp. PMI_390]